jgi:L-lactate dehydrogenase complex protein LldG
MSVREVMLAGIRRRLGARAGDGRDRAVAARLAAPPRGPVPTRTRLQGAALVEEFAARAAAAAATVQRLPDAAAVPAAIADWLKAHNLPAEIRVASDPWLACLPWGRLPTLTAHWGAPAPHDRVGVTTALAGIAETGTLLTVSGRAHPHSLSLLPDVNIVVLPVARLVGCYEEAFEQLRRQGPMPRAASLITGPSRTGDIEQTLVLEAHGPGRVHVLLVEDALARERPRNGEGG